MVDDIKPHIIGITESWANIDITDAELGLEGYVMFRKDRMGRRGGGVLLYIKESIPAYEVQLQEDADCKEALWCNLVTGHTTVTIGVVYRCPNITIQNNEKIHKAISEVSKGDCIIMGDFNHGNINTLSAKDGDLRLSASNACLPKTEISVFVTECVFFTSTCYKLHMFTLHDVLYS